MAATGIIQMQNGVSQHALITGYRCWCKAGNVGNEQDIGFVDVMNATKQIQLQRAQVCGSIMPASIDPQSMSVNISLSGFVATPGVYKGNNAINGVGKVSLASFNPKSEDFIQGNVAVKFPSMVFYDKKSGVVIASFKDVISTSYRVSVQGGAYVKADIQLEAIDMSSGSDYMENSTETDLDQTT